MKIRMRTTAAGPEGVMEGGREYEVPNARALDLLNSGYAEALEAMPRETAVSPVPEMAMRPNARARRGRNA